LGWIYTVHVNNFECLLFTHVAQPNSTPNELPGSKNIRCTIFRKVCELRRLLEVDNHCGVTMKEAVLCRSLAKIRAVYNFIEYLRNF